MNLQILQYDQCDYSANKYSTINIHVKIVHRKEVRYSCSGCEYKSFYKKKVTFHNNHAHVNTEQRVIGIGCLMCEEGELHVKCEITANIKSLNEPKETLKHCTHCNYTTTKKEYFKKHKKLNHGTNSDVSKIIACAQCEYETLDPILARNHNRSIHLQEQKYYCDICGMKSFYRHHVRQHMKGRHKKTNAKVKRINCTQCQSSVERDRCLANKQSRSS